jgi:hypothetical protein
VGTIGYLAGCSKSGLLGGKSCDVAMGVEEGIAGQGKERGERKRLGVLGG